MNASVGDLQKKVATFFGRYHFIIFFVFLISSLGAAILIINSTVLSEQNDGYTSNINSTGFDQATINKLRDLRNPNEETKKIETSGRYNPF